MKPVCIIDSENADDIKDFLESIIIELESMDSQELTYFQRKLLRAVKKFQVKQDTYTHATENPDVITRELPYEPDEPYIYYGSPHHKIGKSSFAVEISSNKFYVVRLTSVAEYMKFATLKTLRYLNLPPDKKIDLHKAKEIVDSWHSNPVIVSGVPYADALSIKRLINDVNGQVSITRI